MKLSIGGKYSIYSNGDVPISLGRSCFRTLVGEPVLSTVSRLACNIMPSLHQKRPEGAPKPDIAEIVNLSSTVKIGILRAASEGPGDEGTPASARARESLAPAGRARLASGDQILLVPDEQSCVVEVEAWDSSNGEPPDAVLAIEPPTTEQHREHRGALCLTEGANVILGRHQADYHQLTLGGLHKIDPYHVDLTVLNGEGAAVAVNASPKAFITVWRGEGRGMLELAPQTQVSHLGPGGKIELLVRHPEVSGARFQVRAGPRCIAGREARKAAEGGAGAAATAAAAPGEAALAEEWDEAGPGPSGAAAAAAAAAAGPAAEEGGSEVVLREDSGAGAGPSGRAGGGPSTTGVSGRNRGQLPGAHHVPGKYDSYLFLERPVLLVLVGLQGAGKSTFAQQLAAAGGWRRVNQDTISNGKRGKREQCIAACRDALSDGLSVVVDRTNYDQEQRSYFLDVASELGARAHVLLFRHSQELCEMRARDRSDHEGGLQGDEAVRAVRMMAGRMDDLDESQAFREGFTAMSSVSSDQEAGTVLRWYREGGHGKEGGGPSGVFFVSAAPEPGSAQVGAARDAAAIMMGAAKDRAAAAAAAQKKGAQGSGHAGPSNPRASPFLKKLRDLALHPDPRSAPDQAVIDVTDKYVMILDKFPKARHHALVIARDPELAWPWDLRREHIPLVKEMVARGERWAEEERATVLKARGPGASGKAELQFKLGFHAAPSMWQLHLHVISQDFDAEPLKSKKHWNSFTTCFFIEAYKVIEQLEATGAFARPEGAEFEGLLGQAARCPHCSFTGSIKDLKAHALSHA